MGLKWEAIKELSGLPREQRQWASFVLVIVTLSSVIAYQNFSNKSDVKTNQTTINEKDNLLYIRDKVCDSVLAANNQMWQEREDKLIAKNQALYEEQLTELKLHQKSLDRELSKTIQDARNTVHTQQSTHVKLKKTIQELKKQDDNEN